MHAHCGHGEAKFWLEPIELARNYGLSNKLCGMNDLLRDVIWQINKCKERGWV